MTALYTLILVHCDILLHSQIDFFNLPKALHRCLPSQCGCWLLHRCWQSKKECCWGRWSSPWLGVAVTAFTLMIWFSWGRLIHHFLISWCWWWGWSSWRQMRMRPSPVAFLAHLWNWLVMRKQSLAKSRPRITVTLILVTACRSWRLNSLPLHLFLMGMLRGVSLKASVSITKNIRQLRRGRDAALCHSTGYLKWIRGISNIKNIGHHPIMKISDNLHKPVQAAKRSLSAHGIEGFC